MGSIYLYKTSNMYGGQTVRLELANLSDLNMTLDQPVSPMALPQETSEQNVLVKMEGNTETITVSWQIHNVDSGSPIIKEKAAISTSGQCRDDAAGTAAISGLADSGYYESNEIAAFLLSTLQGYNISDRYFIAIPKKAGEVIFKEGFVTRINCAISSGSPVVWQGSLTMIVGNVISMYDGDTPNEPRNVAAAQVDNGGDTSGEGGGTATKIRLRWQAPSDTASSITKYRIYRKSGTDTYILAHEINDSGLDGAVSANSAYKEYGVTGLTSGKSYRFKISAINDGGEGMHSDEVSVVFP